MDFTKNPHDASVYYLHLGITPIPLCTPSSGPGGCIQHGPLCSHPGKRPLIKGWATRAITETDIREWWGRWPNANIGGVMGGGIVGIDIDPRNGGWSTVNEFGLHRPIEAVSLSGGGGEHWFYSAKGHHVPTRVLGPGLELHGDRSLMVLPYSLHASGRHYTWLSSQYPQDLGLVNIPNEILNITESIPVIPLNNREKTTSRWSTTSDWVQDAFLANGMNKIEMWDSQERHRQLLRLWHEGVTEGRRWLTLRAILHEAIENNLFRDEINIIAERFSSRCVPPFPRKESKRLVAWFRKLTLPEDRAQFPPVGACVEAWEHGYWVKGDLQKARTGGPNGEPIISPLYLPVSSNNSESTRTKIKLVDALATWHKNLRSTPDADWMLISPEEGLANHTLDEIGRCGGPGVRNCGEHLTKSAHRPCRLNYHEHCESFLQTKARVAAGLKTGSGAAGTYLAGPSTLIRVAVPLQWPWVASTLDVSWLQLKRAIPRLKKRLPMGAICGFRIEPFRAEMAVYLLTPGAITLETPENRGRPPAYNLNIIGTPGSSSYKLWLKYVGGSWCHYVPDDNDAPEAALQLLLWSRNFAQRQGQGKSRTWGIGVLGKALADMRLIHPCPVCGQPTSDAGWFDPLIMEEATCMDRNGLTYTGVVTRGPP